MRFNHRTYLMVVTLSDICLKTFKENGRVFLLQNIFHYFNALIAIVLRASGLKATSNLIII